MKTETFSYIPPFTPEQTAKQIDYFLKKGWIVGIEFSADPKPELVFWSWWKLPMFGQHTAKDVLVEFEACKKANPDSYIRITSYDSARQGLSMCFVAYNPA